MSKFSTREIEYLQSQRLGRPATIGAKGDLHVAPVGIHGEGVMPGMGKVNISSRRVG